MTCILVHRRHSTKLVSLPFSRTICRYALRTQRRPVSIILQILLLRASLDILTYVRYMSIPSLLVHVPLFLSDADILITCDWVMVISGPYISVSVSVFVYFILGYDVPACGCRVPFIYVVLVFLQFLSMVWLDIL